MLKQKLAKTHLYKACPRCGGDLLLDPEEDFMDQSNRLEYVCLQCGRTVALDVASQPRMASRAGWTETHPNIRERSPV